MKDVFFMNKIALRFNFHGVKKVRDGLWNSRCFICGDSKKTKTKKRLFFMLRDQYITVYCHNCGYSSSLRNFIHAYIPDMKEEYDLWGFKERVKEESVAEKLDKTLEEYKPKTVLTNTRLFGLTVDFDSLDEEHPARSYVKRRRIPFDKVRFCPNFAALHKRITRQDNLASLSVPCLVIPFFQRNEEIDIFQVRFFDPKIKPKYLTVKINEEAPKIYNKDFVSYKETVFVLEGPIDSMSVPNSIAMAGSDMSQTLPKGDYVYVYDNEVTPEILSKLEEKISKGEKVVVWRSTDDFKDINEGVCSGKLKDVVDFLKERTLSGLKAKLALTRRKR